MKINNKFPNSTMLADEKLLYDNRLMKDIVSFYNK
jgi:hypothetical protein